MLCVAWCLLFLFVAVIRCCCPLLPLVLLLVDVCVLFVTYIVGLWLFVVVWRLLNSIVLLAVVARCCVLLFVACSCMVLLIVGVVVCCCCGVCCSCLLL